MNIFPPLNSLDPEYKTYQAQYKKATKQIGVGDTIDYRSQMDRIISKFPYFEHTNATIMAIAMTLASSGSKTFEREKALSYLELVSSFTEGKKDRQLLLIDVARYWERLTSQ